MTPGRWRTTDRFDASLDVLGTLDHEVSRRGAYAAYIGCRRAAREGAGAEHRGDRTRHHRSGAAVPADRPPAPARRPVRAAGVGPRRDRRRRRSPRHRPRVQASKAAPDRSIDRVVAERGWVDVDELELLTGERSTHRRTMGDHAASCAATRARLSARSSTPATSDSTSRRSTTTSVPSSSRSTTSTVDAGRARPADVVDPFDDHPLARDDPGRRVCSRGAGRRRPGHDS